MMGGYGRSGGYGYGMHGGIGGGEIVVIILGLLVLVGIVLLIVWAVRSSSHGHGSDPGSAATRVHDEAMALARKRLASGEITPEEFEKIRMTLDG